MTEYEKLKEKYRKILVPCELCGSEDQHALQHWGRVAEAGVYGDVPVTVCGRCGHKQQNPRYQDQFYIEYYECMYREVAFGSARPSDEYIAQQKARGAGVLDYVAGLGIAPGRMLDHGCASGATMLAWQDRGWQVRGIDPHRPSVEAGRELGLEIEIAAGEKLPQANNTFDLVLSLGSLEHAYDLAAAMAEINRVLRVGGHLVIRWRSAEIFGSPLEYYNHNHNRYFTPTTWTLTLARFGFEATARTDDRLEGWDSYSYIVARKATLPDMARLDRLVAEGVRDDWELEVAELETLRRDYYERCTGFIALARRHADDPDAVIRTVRSGDAGFRWGLLGGAPDWVVSRSLMEAERYVREFEAGRVR